MSMEDFGWDEGVPILPVVGSNELVLVQPPEDEMDDESSDKSGIARTLRVIEYVTVQSPEQHGVSAIARALSMPKGVAYRILKELSAARFLRFDEDDKVYGLGPAALKVGLVAMRSLDIPRLTKPYLERLARDTGETATLSVRQGSSRIYVDQVLSHHEISMRVRLATSYPLYAGASSKAILAALEDDEIEDYLRHTELVSLTEATVTSREILWNEISAVREQGYALSVEERQSGASSIAAAIYSPEQRVWGAVSVCGPSDRFSLDVKSHYVNLVTQTAAMISAEAGYSPEMRPDVVSG